MAFGNRHRDTSRVQLTDIEEILGEVELEKKLLVLEDETVITGEDYEFLLPEKQTTQEDWCVSANLEMQSMLNNSCQVHPALRSENIQGILQVRH